VRSAPKPVGGGGSVRVPPECTRVRRATTEVFRMGAAPSHLHRAGPGCAGRSDGSLSSTFSRVIGQKPVLGGYTVLADGALKDSEPSGSP
jgi:hypothetical protein